VTATALTATDLVLEGKGILAADESGPTTDALLRRAGVAPGAESRRAYREMLVTTPGLSLGISGVILGDEAFRQRLADGRSFPEALADRGLLPGIRVDTGARPLAGAPGETVTEGLDGLRARLAGYAARGARFAAWRAVLRVGDGRPSWRALRANAYALARYALACQEEGAVPVIEVLVEGTHGPARGREVTSAVLMVTVTELQDMGVALEGVVLVPSMVRPDAGGSEPAAPEIVAQQTVAALWCVVPEEVAGVAFPATGQRPARATANLAALRRLGPPWPVTFCFGPALADPALAAWHGDPACVAAGQRALANRVACNVAALQGTYTAVLEPGYVLCGRDARAVPGPGAQGSSSTGSPTATGPGSTVEP
jgi:fructose-bisphosphate aldolase, class I